MLSGKMSYHANVTMASSFLEEIWPLVRRFRPDASVLIVGKSPPSRIRAYGDNEAVTVTGAVPDVRPYLRRATIAAAPIVYGAGIQNKVLEAMATATPVVASPLAVQALDVRSGRELEVADGPEAFARSIVDLLGDPVRRQELAQAGREYVERKHDWAEITAQLERYYDALIDQA